MLYTENRLSNQDFRRRTHQTRKANVVIENYCWIGAYVFVREGATIGDNVVIGAHSVVTKDIPSNSIAVGVPAKVIARLMDVFWETIQSLFDLGSFMFPFSVE